MVLCVVRLCVVGMVVRFARTPVAGCRGGVWFLCRLGSFRMRGGAVSDAGGGAVTVTWGFASRSEIGTVVCMTWGGSKGVCEGGGFVSVSGMHAKPLVGASHSTLRTCTAHLSEVRLRRPGNVPGTSRGHLVCTRLVNDAGHDTGTKRERMARRAGPAAAARRAPGRARKRPGHGPETRRRATHTNHAPPGPRPGARATEHTLATEGCGTPRKGRPHPGPTRTQPCGARVRWPGARTGYVTYTKRVRAGGGPVPLPGVNDTDENAGTAPASKPWFASLLLWAIAGRAARVGGRGRWAIALRAGLWRG